MATLSFSTFPTLVRRFTLLAVDSIPTDASFYLWECRLHEAALLFAHFFLFYTRTPQRKMTERKMEEGGNVRVVRCPRCQKLLPEFPGIPVYRCGGCDATLEAKKRMSGRTDAASKNMDEEKARFCDESVDSSEKRSVLNAISETECEASGEKGRGISVLLGEMSLNCCENVENLADSDGSSSWHEATRCRRLWEGLVSSINMKSNSEELGIIKPKEHGEAIASAENGGLLPSIESMAESCIPNREGLPFLRCRACVVEGPSNHHFYSPCDNGEESKNHKYHQSDTVANLEKDRAQLLRELDELRNQLTISDDGSDCIRENFPINRLTARSNEGTCPAKGNYSEAQLQKLCIKNDQSSPLMGRRDPVAQIYNHPLHFHNDISMCIEPFGSQVTIRDQSCPLGFYEQPPCSCLQCYSRRTVFPDQRSPNAAVQWAIRHPENSDSFNVGSCNHSFVPWCSSDSRYHTRKLSDFDRNADGFGSSWPERPGLVRRNQRCCRTVSDVSPFITCCHCSKVLQLPDKLSLREGNQYKFLCGACSNVTSFTFDGKKFVCSFDSQTVPSPNSMSNNPCKVKREGFSVNACSTKGILKPNLYNYDNSIYNVQPADGKQISSLPFGLTGDDPAIKESVLNVGMCVKMEELSLPSFSSGDEKYPSDLNVQRSDSDSTGCPSKDNILLPVADLHLQEQFQYSLVNKVIDHCNNGNPNKHSDKKFLLPNKKTRGQHSLKDASVATEIEVSSIDHPNSAISVEPLEPSKEDDRYKLNKGSDSFFAVLMKKGLKDFSKLNQPLGNGQPRVTVNGQPIPDSLVRKAEKKAGKIHPGRYWYDYKAGFWGVMGYHCLGIIPPFIEEFKHPLPKDCSDGDTGVFVNGRELPQRDMDLLTGRGLPTTRSKHYLIEISGRVIDESSGEELKNLGKLAPTVERLNHGFGMWVPVSLSCLFHPKRETVADDTL